MVEFRRFSLGRTEIRLSDSERKWASETFAAEGERMLREVGFYAAMSGAIKESQDDMDKGAALEEDIISTDRVIVRPASEVAQGYADYHRLKSLKRDAQILSERYDIEEGGVV